MYVNKNEGVLYAGTDSGVYYGQFSKDIARTIKFRKSSMFSDGEIQNNPKINGIIHLQHNDFINNFNDIVVATEDGIYQNEYVDGVKNPDLILFNSSSSKKCKVGEKFFIGTSDGVVDTDTDDILSCMLDNEQVYFNNKVNTLDNIDGRKLVIGDGYGFNIFELSDSSVKVVETSEEPHKTTILNNVSSLNILWDSKDTGIIYNTDINGAYTEKLLNWGGREISGVPIMAYDNMFVYNGNIF